MACQFQKERAAELLEYCGPRTQEKTADLVESHLLLCTECRAWIKEQQSVTALLSEWTVADVGSEFEAAVWAKVNDLPPESLWERWKQWLLFVNPVHVRMAAATLTLLIAVIISGAWWHVAKPVSHGEKVDIEKVEQTVDDMDLLRTLTATSVTHTSKGTSL